MDNHYILRSPVDPLEEIVSCPINPTDRLRRKPFKMDLYELNKVAEGILKPTGKLQDFGVGTPQKILSAKVVETKFGKSIVLELNEVEIFLPKPDDV